MLLQPICMILEELQEQFPLWSFSMWLLLRSWYLLWSFGVVGSQKPKEAHLSQDLIVLLSIGNVPASFFIELVKKALDNVCNMFKQWELAYKGIHFQVLIFSTHKISEYEV